MLIYFDEKLLGALAVYNPHNFQQNKKKKKQKKNKKKKIIIITRTFCLTSNVVSFENWAIFVTNFEKRKKLIIKSLAHSKL